MKKITTVNYYDAAGSRYSSFPLDMLRYDCAFVAPTSIKEEDGRWVPTNPESTIVAIPTQRGWQPRMTEGRWRSFLWGIRHVSPMETEGNLLTDDWIHWNGGEFITYKEWKER